MRTYQDLYIGNWVIACCPCVSTGCPGLAKSPGAAPGLWGQSRAHKPLVWIWFSPPLGSLFVKSPVLRAGLSWARPWFMGFVSSLNFPLTLRCRCTASALALWASFFPPLPLKTIRVYSLPKGQVIWADKQKVVGPVGKPVWTQGPHI